MMQSQAGPRTVQPERRKEERSRRRTVAEWVSLVTSALLLLGVVVFLVSDGLREPPPFVPAETRPRIDHARRVGDQYVVPIEVRNGGDRTLRSLEIEATYRTADGKEETQELTLDYLGEGSTTTLYLYLDQEPGRAELEVRPAHYQSD